MTIEETTIAEEAATPSPDGSALEGISTEDPRDTGVSDAYDVEDDVSYGLADLDHEFQSDPVAIGTCATCGQPESVCRAEGP